ncbi:putative quinol monooxygenase [Kineococcus arenarius]|uniref:putative quinol monooxygenase n=1 Tax=Kineococcus sp. SYSU DK007 TaxID=3383128 RepID=UPI003D7D31BA
MSLVIVHGGITVTPERLEEVTAAAVDFASACRAESGCREYQLSWLTGAPQQLRLLEIWDSEETYTAHSAQPHVRQWTSFISAAASAPPAFTKLLLEEGGQPSSDQGTHKVQVPAG